MFFELRKKYDSAIKELELEIQEIENKILENEFNIELLKSNSIINENEKEKVNLRYSLKYNKENFIQTAKIPNKTKTYDISDNNNEREETI
jgi:hypothetical protein